MPAKTIDGIALANKLKQKVKDDVLGLKDEGIAPGLAVVMVGENPASKVYVTRKQVSCEEVGIHSEKTEFTENVDEATVIKKISELNSRNDIHGILVQLPLPQHLNEKKILQTVFPEKDVDGFHVVNSGELYYGENLLVPNTSRGIIALIKSTGEKIEGKHAVVVGRSKVVGKPTAMLLLQENATVTVCHTKTKNLPDFTREADILVVATGVPHLIRAEMVKKSAIVIDVGITRMVNGKFIGDVDFEGVKEVAGWISPAPGGVGPMTVACLMENTVKTCRMQTGALD